MGCESSAEKKERLFISANNGDRNAQYQYAYDYGSTKDDTIKYLKMAAEQGHRRAACILGNLYHYGTQDLSSYNPILRAKIDYVEAYKWYDIGKHLKGIREMFPYVQAEERRVKIQRGLCEREIKRIDLENKSIVERARVLTEVQNESAEGLFRLGMAYFVGPKKEILM